MPTWPDGVEVLAPVPAGAERVLTSDALAFVAALHRAFDARRRELLAERQRRQAAFDAGALPDFRPETADVRTGDWTVAPPPPDLEDRRVEITGPVDRKMIINALNSGARVFMADFEDALSPTWSNVVLGQLHLHDAVRRTIAYRSPEGKEYVLGERPATLVVRPRGWHLPERHVRVDGLAVSGSLFDFGLYLFHNAGELRRRGTGPYFYLPKLESHLEARLWNDVFLFAQERLGLPRGTIRATVLVETILAAFEMDEILFELRDHITGLNAGRWDYIFSVIKKFPHRREWVLPDRAQVTMTVPFMHAYTELLVRTCHRRGAHAIGGMAAFVPNRRDPEATERALAKVREDKEREAGQGFDGTWVAHPDLVPVAQAVFDRVLGERPHQKHRLREDVQVSARDLLDIRVPGGRITEAGARNNVNVALQYLAHWLGGTGAVAIHNLMEDAATAEIARAQLWQWRHHRACLDDGRPVDEAFYRRLREDEVAALAGLAHLEAAAALLDELVLAERIPEFFTLRAYERLG